MNGQLYPLRYRIDQSRVLEDVVFQPQFLTQLRFRTDSYAAWLTFMRGPSPEPDPEISGHSVISREVEK